jgi:dTDP-6-deoxy-L-talose 4-dehydrogenase (NAD+)
MFYIMGQPGRASLFDQLAKAIKEGRKSFDLTGGEQLRDYLNVEQVAVNLKKVAERANHSMVINLGSGRPVSIRSLVERVVMEKKSNVRLNWGGLPYRSYEPMGFWADVTKMNGLLGLHNASA